MEIMMKQTENSYRYFKNEQCKYFPCHDLAQCSQSGAFNCLFCYCPLNPYEDCPGNPKYITAKNGKRIKSCEDCTFPHKPENYDKVVAFLAEKLKA